MSTKKHLAIWAGSALLATGAIAGCDAGDPGAPATEDPASENLAMYEPDDNANDQSGAMQDDPSMTDDQSMTDPMDDRSMAGNQSAGSAESLASMSDDEIVGKPILSRDGEEIGDVDEIVVDATTGDKFAVVDVGGFLGIGEKSIVVPLDELSLSNDDRIQSDLTRETLQTETEYDPANFESSPDPL